MGYLDWYREALFRKLDGLTEEQLRTPVEGLGWPVLALVKHLGWVERRWLRWGFLAEDVLGRPPGGTPAEWRIEPDEPTADVVAAYRAQVERSRAITAAAGLDEPSAVGGRFPTPEAAPPMGRILFHLLQEYARHLGQLDAARQLLDGVTGP
nr:DinB family protein [Motilibacter aurantiacus]